MVEKQHGERNQPLAPNLAALMFSRARKWPRKILFRFHRDGAWRTMSWKEFARSAASAARAFRAMGVAPGDRVMICSENRPEIAIAELGLMAVGAVPVPAYTTNTVADHTHILTDSGAKLAIVSTQALAAKVASVGKAEKLIVMDKAREGQIPFQTLLETRSGGFKALAKEAAAIPPEQLACLIYTSGTGGSPKGVMLPHRAMLSNIHGAEVALAPLKLRNETYFSFLPLSHAFEHTIGLFFLASIGTQIAYARSLETLAADMLEIRPTVMLVVPRFLALLRTRILAQVARQPRWRRKLFARATQTPAKAEGRVAETFLDLFVRRKVIARFGGRLRAVMSGGARLDPDLGLFFRRLGIEMMQGYGQTEAGPVISANLPGQVDLETVGPPFPDVNLKIAEDGEILVQGDLVMSGYWNNPAATKEAIKDGWLHTGDVGHLDQNGNLKITDRKKDFIVLSGGDKVSPARVEGRLMEQPEIAQAVISGEGQTGISAFLVLAEGVTPMQGIAAVARVNLTLAVYERVRHPALVPPFTIENGLLTPTQKIRRQLVIQTHKDVLLQPQTVDGGG